MYSADLTVGIQEVHDSPAGGEYQGVIKVGDRVIWTGKSHGDSGSEMFGAFLEAQTKLARALEALLRDSPPEASKRAVGPVAPLSVGARVGLFSDTYTQGEVTRVTYDQDEDRFFIEVLWRNGISSIVEAHQLVEIRDYKA